MEHLEHDVMALLIECYLRSFNMKCFDVLSIFLFGLGMYNYSLIDLRCGV